MRPSVDDSAIGNHVNQRDGVLRKAQIRTTVRVITVDLPGVYLV
jgi:hypothetical protein